MNYKRLTLRSFLENHDREQEKFNFETFPQVIGDRHFYKHSPIYKNIRRAALSLGYKYEIQPPFDYLIFPLMSLGDILDSRTIPLLDNISCLRKIESRAPNRFFVSDLKSIGPLPNYLLHESAHCIVHSVFNEFTPTSACEAEKIKLFKIMLGESFANSAEVLASQASVRTALDSWLIQMNFYQTSKLKDFVKMQDSIGVYNLTKICIAFFLYSNFLYKSLGALERNRIFDFAGINFKVRKNKKFIIFFKTLEQNALNLAVGFRLITTEFYLKSLGFKKGLFSLCSFDPILFALQSPELMATINTLCKVVAENSYNLNTDSFIAA